MKARHRLHLLLQSHLKLLDVLALLFVVRAAELEETASEDKRDCDEDFEGSCCDELLVLEDAERLQEGD